MGSFLFDFSYKSYNDLSIKYNGFKVPVMKLLINDNIISLVLSALGSNTALGIMTDGVTVTLNKDSASSASFNLINCYDPLVRKFTEKIGVGSKICIMMGYGSFCKSIFVGYVDSVSYEFSEKPLVKITAFDAVQLMKSGGSQKRNWPINTLYIKTFKEIMNNYSDICPVSDINIVPSLKKHGYLVQDSNDYDYLKETFCKYFDRDFIVIGGEGYLIKPYSNKIKLTTLGFGKGLLRFSVTPLYKKVSVVVTGARQLDIKAKSKVKTGQKYKTSMDNEQRIVKENVPFTSVSDCKAYADRLASDAISEAQKASGECIGIPEIVPGRAIGLEGIDLTWSGRTYYIESATHSFNSGGYTTSFEIKGWD